jgi:hypothetical protein
MLSNMADQWRADKTVDKMRRGGLPAPTEHTTTIGIGDGSPCNGCTETIEPTETMRAVRVRRILDLWFHDTCYTAWATFTPR